jgi:hypothetical protein
MCTHPHVATWCKTFYGIHMPARPFNNLSLRIIKLCQNRRSPHNAVSILSYYGLGNWPSIPSRCRGFSSGVCVHTGPGANSACYPMGPGGSLSWGWNSAGEQIGAVPPLLPSRIFKAYNHTSCILMWKKYLFNFSSTVDVFLCISKCVSGSEHRVVKGGISNWSLSC